MGCTSSARTQTSRSTWASLSAAMAKARERVAAAAIATSLTGDTTEPAARVEAMTGDHRRRPMTGATIGAGASTAAATVVEVREVATIEAATTEAAMTEAATTGAATTGAAMTEVARVAVMTAVLSAAATIVTAAMAVVAVTTVDCPPGATTECQIADLLPETWAAATAARVSGKVAHPTRSFTSATSPPTLHARPWTWSSAHMAAYRTSTS
mmetsp:Transcript_70049/g.226661  ORF Transcript_70049/g.226661 Transcript_70049/m.226661 type:complete len:212 (-) Transcript_70049:334-969(-)